jgi:hypothetical protein
MHRWSVIPMVCILTSGLAACVASSVGQTPVASPTSAIDTGLTLVSQHYTVEDLGDGRNRGSVWLAFENDTDHLAGWDSKELLPPVIRTVEGQDYQGRLIFYDDTGAAFVASSIDDVPMIPPGFRVPATAGGRTYCPRWPALVRFEIPYAAHPTDVVFPGTKLRIDLSASQTLPLGYVGSGPVQSIAELYGRVLVDDLNGAKVTVSGCRIDSRSMETRANLLLTIENRDKLQEAKVTVRFPQTTFVQGDGGVVPYVSGHSNVASYTVGPGQTETRAFQLESDRWVAQLGTALASYAIVYDEPPETYSIYALDRCTVEQ